MPVGVPAGVILIAQLRAERVVGADGVSIDARAPIGIVVVAVPVGRILIILRKRVGPILIFGHVVAQRERRIIRVAAIGAGGIGVVLVVVVPPRREPVGAQGGVHVPTDPAVRALAPELHVGAIVVGQLVGGERRAALEVAQVHFHVAEVVAAPERAIDDDVAIGLAVREHGTVGGDHLGRHGLKLVGIGDDNGGIDAVDLGENGLGNRGYPVGLENGAAVGVLLHLLQVGIGRRCGQLDEIGAVEREGFVHAGERVAVGVDLVRHIA